MSAIVHVFGGRVMRFAPLGWGMEDITDSYNSSPAEESSSSSYYTGSLEFPTESYNRLLFNNSKMSFPTLAARKIIVEPTDPNAPSPSTDPRVVVVEKLDFTPELLEKAQTNNAHFWRLRTELRRRAGLASEEDEADPKGAWKEVMDEQRRMYPNPEEWAKVNPLINLPDPLEQWRQSQASTSQARPLQCLGCKAEFEAHLLKSQLCEKCQRSTK